MKPLYFWSTIFIGLCSLSIVNSIFWIIGAVFVGGFIVIDMYSKVYTSSMGFQLLPLKKIHTEYGTFYIKIIDNRSDNYSYIYLYRSNLFRFIRIDYFEYSDVESLKKNINTCLEHLYGYQKSLKERKDKEKKEILQWNGMTSKVIDRDEKLKKLI